MSEVKVDKISPRAGTDVTLGDASDTFTLPASATIQVASSGEIDIASGATLDVNGTIDVTGATVTGLSAGKVLQVVSANSTSHDTTTSSSYQITSHGVSITPTTTGNPIVVTLGGGSLSQDSGAKMAHGSLQRTAPTTATFGSVNARVYAGSSSITAPCSITIYDTAASTAVHTYKLYIKTDSGGRVRFNQQSDTSYMVAWEIEQ